MDVEPGGWMNRIAVFLTVGLALAGPDSLRAQSVDLSDPLATAVLPLPQDLREGATIIDQTAESILRRGSNGFTCLADVPHDDRLSLQCHPSAVEPYMRRGRELSSEGIRGSEQRSVLAAEVRTGRLYLPTGAMLRLISGPINVEVGVPDSVRVWSEFLFPFGTTTELGIPATDQGLDPWMMRPGDVGAHVMVRYRSVPWSEIH